MQAMRAAQTRRTFVYRVWCSVGIPLGGRARVARHRGPALVSFSPRYDSDLR